VFPNFNRLLRSRPVSRRYSLVEGLEPRRLLSASTVTEEFTAGTFTAFYGNNLLTAVNLSSEAIKTYPLNPWSSEFTLTSGTGAAGENILAFYSGGTLTTVNLSGQSQNSYTVGASTEQWTAGSVVAFYDNGLLTTVDVGSGALNTYSIGNFSQEFSVSATSTGATATPNILAFYANQTLTTVNVSTKNEATYTVGDFSQEWTLGVGTGPNAQTILAFYTAGMLTAINLVTQNAAVYNIVASATQEWAAGSILAFYKGGDLTTVDVGSSAINSYGIGNFVQEFTVASSGTGPTAVPNILAFYDNRTLTTINVNTQNVQTYSIGNFTQEWMLSISGGTPQNVLAFDNGSTVSTVNLATDTLTAYPVNPNSVQEWTGGSVVAFYSAGTLTTLDVSTGGMHSFSVGSFSDAFTATVGSGPSAPTAIIFYNSADGSLTAVNLSTENQTPFEDIGPWTQEWTSSSATTAILAFYSNGIVTAEDVSTGNVTKYPIGTFRDEWTLAPQASPQGVLAFYNDNGTVTAANLASGTTSNYPGIGPWTEEWTASSVAASTVPPTPPATGPGNASSAVGTNILVFYNNGGVGALDVAAGTFNSLFNITATPQVAQMASLTSIEDQQLFASMNNSSLFGEADGNVLAGDFKMFKVSLGGVRHRAIAMEKSMSCRGYANSWRKLAHEAASLANMDFNRIETESKRLRKRPGSAVLMSALGADISRLQSNLKAGAAICSAIAPPIADPASKSPEAAEQESKFILALDLANMDIQSLQDQLAQ